MITKSKIEVLEQLGSCVKRDPSDLIVIAGDFNCEWPEDATNERVSWGHFALSRATDGWFGGWTRVIPPCPTYVGTMVSPAKCLDGFLINARISFAKEAQVSAATMCVREVLCSQKCSDHLPVQLAISSDPGNRPSSFAAHLAQNPDWGADVRELLRLVDFSSLSVSEGLPFLYHACARARKNVNLDRSQLPELLESDVYHLQVAIRCWVRGRHSRLMLLLERAPRWKIPTQIDSQTGSSLDRLLLRKKELLALERDEHLSQRVRAGELREHHLRTSRFGGWGCWPLGSSAHVLACC